MDVFDLFHHATGLFLYCLGPMALNRLKNLLEEFFLYNLLCCRELFLANFYLHAV